MGRGATLDFTSYADAGMNRAGRGTLRGRPAFLDLMMFTAKCMNGEAIDEDDHRLPLFYLMVTLNRETRFMTDSAYREIQPAASRAEALACRLWSLIVRGSTATAPATRRLPRRGPSPP